MKLLILLLLCVVMHSCGQTNEIPQKPRPFSQLWAYSPKDNSLESLYSNPNLIYYPFYDNVQMVEVDYILNWKKKKMEYELSLYGEQGLRYARSFDPMVLFPSPPKNAFIFRNRKGEVVRHYNISQEKLDAISFLEVSQVSTSNTIYHKERTTLIEDGYSYLFSKHLVYTEKGIGLIDTFGKVLLKPMNELITMVDSCYYIKRKGEVELRDLNFNQLFIKPYDGIMPFKDQVFLTIKDKLYGIIKKDGTELVSPKYKSAPFPYSNNLYKVFEEKWGFINEEGKEVCNPIYDEIFDFREGFGIVKREEKYGFINKKGKEVIECKYISVGSFHNGRAKAKLTFQKWGFIDTTGNVVIAPRFNKVGDFQADQCVVCNDSLFAVKDKKQHYLMPKCGIINQAGDVLIPLKYQNIGLFSEGLCAACSLNASTGKTKCGYINKEGDIIIPFKFNYIGRPFYKGKSLIITKNSSFYINKDGKRVKDSY